MKRLSSRTVYNNNFNLKRTNVEFEYTEDQIQEILKCKKDIFYFAENYVKIVSLDKGEQLFKLYSYQKDIVRKIKKNRYVVILAARQCGKSVTCMLPILHNILFKNNWTAAILANKKENAIKLLDRLKKMFESLPIWLKQGTREWAKGYIELENGSKVIAEATTSSAGRSFSLNYLFLDEFAMVPNNIAHEFYSATYPTISSGSKTKIVISSTPQGLNLFHKIYTEAVHKINNFVPVKVTWNQVPGRGKAWKEETIKNVGEQKFKVEYECEFIGSVATLVDGEAINNLSRSSPIRAENGLYYYKEPQKDRIYFLALDAAEGVGNDSTAFSVIDISNFPYEVVATYDSDKIRPLECPALLNKIGRYYNEAFILCEINYAPEIPYILFNEYEYQNILSTMSSGKPPQQVLCGGFSDTKKLGLKTTASTKRLGCNMIKDMIESGKIIINCERLIAQLSTYTRSGSTYKADIGYKDDLVSSLIVFGWATTQEYYRNLIKNSISDYLIAEYEASVSDDFPSLGVIPAVPEKKVVSDGCLWSVITAFNFYGKPIQKMY